MFNVFSVVPATRRAAFVLALLVTAGAAVALPTRALAVAATGSTVSCNGTSLQIRTPGAANSFGSYQLFGTGPGLPSATPDQTSGNQDQGFEWPDISDTVTVPGPGTWTDLTVWQANGVSYTLKDTIAGSFTCGTASAAPVLTLPSNITAEATSASGAVVAFAASATDTNPPSPTVTCTPASGSTFALGATTVNCSATDAAGNAASGSFKVTVVDTTPPTLTLPANITVNATGPTGAVVTFSATATDLVDGSRPVSCAPASGSTFAITTTTVNCSATDAAGNAASGSFTVTVQGPSALAATLVAHSTGVAPGTALLDKAKAIQTVVNAGDTSTACAGITDYLGLVKAQTGKKLSRSTAMTLTDDADSLSTALGCT